MNGGHPRPRIAFLLLAHEHPALCARLVSRLLEEGDGVFLHLDAKCDDAFRPDFEAHLGQTSEQVHWVERVAVEWGGWSMIEATLSGLRAIREAQGPGGFDYVYLLSGADYPIQGLPALRAYLQRHPDRDFIEHKPADTVPWVAGGFQRERYEYRHWLSWRKYPRLFSLNTEVQKRLRLKRRFPEGLTPHIGSQWWVLRWSTCELVLDTLAENPALERFFRTTVVPDELFFQTLVASLRPAEAVEDRHLTLYEFTELGVPVTYYDGHEDMLARQPFFFARKLSPRALELRDALDRTTRRDQDPASRENEDAAVGHVTDDYQRFRREHVTGLWGQRSWGRPGITPLGELERVKTPYFVLLAHGPGRLLPAREAIPVSREWLCHGPLFDSDQAIQLGQAVAAATGYGPSDQALRDQDRPGFLADVLRASAELAPYVGWMLTTPRSKPGQDDAATRDLLRLLAADPNCHLVHIATLDEHRGLRQSLAQDCPVALGLQLRATWFRVPPREDQATGSEWLAPLREALDDRRQACERRHRALLAGEPKPRLTLHIGIHRTGTTALQRALGAARPALAEHDVHYAFDTINHNFLAEGIQHNERHKKSFVQQLIDEGLDSGKGHIVVSAENLASLRDPWSLWDLQRHFDVQVLAYLRRQDRWLESWYNQAIRWPWNADIAGLDPDAFYHRVRRFHWLDYRALHRRWSAVFGADRVHFRNFERARGDLLGDFCAAVGLPEGVLGKPAAGVNASGSPLMTEALRHLDLMGRSNSERLRLVAAVRQAFATADWTGPSHAFSASQRRRLLKRHRRSNDWVAREVLHQEPPLFEGDWPEGNRARPDLSLPDPEALLSHLGPTFLHPWLGALPRQAPLARLPEAQRRRLVALLRRKQEAQGALPDTRRPARDRSAHELAERFHDALGVADLPDDRRRFAESVLEFWSGRAEVPDRLPDSTERLLSDCLGPLATEAERLLLTEIEARHWVRGDLELRLEELEQSLR